MRTSCELHAIRKYTNHTIRTSYELHAIQKYTNHTIRTSYELHSIRKYTNHTIRTSYEVYTIWKYTIHMIRTSCELHAIRKYTNHTIWTSYELHTIRKYTNHAIRKYTIWTPSESNSQPIRSAFLHVFIRTFVWSYRTIYERILSDRTRIDPKPIRSIRTETLVPSLNAIDCVFIAIDKTKVSSAETLNPFCTVLYMHMCVEGVKAERRQTCVRTRHTWSWQFRSVA